MEEDKTITCIGLLNKPCGVEFVWTKDEQKFYADKGFQPPKRCKACAQLKRQEVKEREAAIQ